ncbi:MAG: hypothetical protein LBC53_00860 [Spirochaetaceae bacterium]|jgi:hypothetical protein|nr:hypothetical protein [Spirochaetaceae bacterium]
MPEGLNVYGPQITKDGVTTTLTYTVSADFSDWAESSLAYILSGSLKQGETPEAQSVEALTTRWASFFTSKDKEYKLNSKRQNEDLTPYAILQLDTTLIKEHLQKLIKAEVSEEGEKTYEKVLWIEDNIGGIVKIEGLDDGEASGEEQYWPCKNDCQPPNTLYQGTSRGSVGIRIFGLHKEGDTPTLAISGDIDNFDDGAAVDLADSTKTGAPANRIASISTILAGGKNKKGERYTSVINFYAGVNAGAIVKELNFTPAAPESVNYITPSSKVLASESVAGGDFSSSKKAKTWIDAHKPVLKVVYEWADGLNVDLPKNDE